MPFSNLPNTPNQSTSLVNYDVPSDLYDAVVGWFNGNGFSITSSNLLAGVLITTVIDNNGTPQDVLNTLQTYQNINPNAAQLSDLVAYLLNSSRVPTSYLGNVDIIGSSKLYNRLVL